MPRAAVALFVLVRLLGCGGATKTSPPVTNTAPTTPPPPAIDDREAVEDTAFLVRTLAFEAFPQWAVAHPDQECPGALAELGEYMPEPRTSDPWGTELRMLCGATLPAGVKGLAVQSAGADRQFDTADDVRSWESGPS